MMLDGITIPSNISELPEPTMGVVLFVDILSETVEKPSKP
jgi:hypothetical protein